MGSSKYSEYREKCICGMRKPDDTWHRGFLCAGVCGAERGSVFDGVDGLSDDYDKWNDTGSGWKRSTGRNSHPV